jgi:hypothetical protein
MLNIRQLCLHLQELPERGHARGSRVGIGHHSTEAVERERLFVRPVRAFLALIPHYSTIFGVTKKATKAPLGTLTLGDDRELFSSIVEVPRKSSGNRLDAVLLPLSLSVLAFIRRCALCWYHLTATSASLSCASKDQVNKESNVLL